MKQRFHHTIEILTANTVIYRGVETVDWENPTVETVKAHVGYRSTGLSSQEHNIVFSRELLALMPVIQLDPEKNRIRFEGVEYMITRPEIRYRYGKPIFQSVGLHTNT